MQVFHFTTIIKKIFHLCKTKRLFLEKNETVSVDKEEERSHGCDNAVKGNFKVPDNLQQGFPPDNTLVKGKARNKFENKEYIFFQIRSGQKG